MMMVGGGGGGGSRAASPAANKVGPPNHLLALSDCFVPGGSLDAREIRYTLQDANGNNVNNYYVTEHIFIRDPARPGQMGPPDTSGITGPNGTSTQAAGMFLDAIGGLSFHDVLQNFSVSINQEGSNSIPVYVIDDQETAYGVNGIYIKSGNVFVNGSQAQYACQGG